MIQVSVLCPPCLLRFTNYISKITSQGGPRRQPSRRTSQEHRMAKGELCSTTFFTRFPLFVRLPCPSSHHQQTIDTAMENSSNSSFSACSPVSQSSHLPVILFCLYYSLSGWMVSRAQNQTKPNSSSSQAPTKASFARKSFNFLVFF